MIFCMSAPFSVGSKMIGTVQGLQFLFELFALHDLARLCFASEFILPRKQFGINEAIDTGTGAGDDRGLSPRVAERYASDAGIVAAGAGATDGARRAFRSFGLGLWRGLDCTGYVAVLRVQVSDEGWRGTQEIRTELL